MVKESVPRIHFYDQDFVDMYDRAWVWLEELWHEGEKDGQFPEGYFTHGDSNVINLFDVSMSSLYLVYSNQAYSPYSMVDYFYNRQAEDGQIAEMYDINTNSPVFTEDNPLGVTLPLLPYVEYLFYHKIGNKKRLKDVVPFLEKYYEWMKNNFQQENGLYVVPSSATHMGNLPRENAKYTVDFNAAVACFALYMSTIGDILNDKELAFRYKRVYFALKTRINSMMWSTEDHFYYDLDENGAIVRNKHAGAFWTLLAEVPNDEYAAFLIDELKDDKEFGTDNPFPAVPVSSQYFSADGNGFCGGVSSFLTYIIIKGLINYDSFIFARECAIRHMYFVLDTLHPGEDKIGDAWEYYKPLIDGPAVCPEGVQNRKRCLPSIGLVAITLVIENIIGLDISLPRKTVYWTMQDLEEMGIEQLSLKKNDVTIISHKNQRGWEIRLESEKLYYFTIHILDEDKKKTLPIPSGKCSMLIDKL
ncbi:MAG: hypothetical protein KBS81_09265 [Spirochaetales bacterium]|nr:hypothetical protein [Candidatus Physcosoma equi]